MDVDESWWTVSATDSQLERERDGFLDILTDLIAELRDWDSYYCKAAAADIADRAEARLRKVTDE